MNQGKIVEYIDHGGLVCTLCLQDRGNRLHLLTPSNREVNLSSKRALLVSRVSVDTENRTREALISELKQREETRNRLQKEVRVEEIWELVREEGEGFPFRYLAELWFGDGLTDDQVSAVVRALFHDKLYFKMKEDRFLPHSEQRVEEITREIEEEREREQRIREGSRWLSEALEGRAPEDFPARETVVSLLVDLALHGEDAPGLKDGRELLARAGRGDVREARGLLVRLGIWGEDENLDLLRFEIRTAFPEDLQTESERLAGRPLSRNGRTDLRDLPVLTIDGALTRDFDDALSLETDGDTLELGVHIADVAGVISPGSTLDREAALRGSSLYLPCSQIPMLPYRLSQETLSLIEGQDREAISLLCRFDAEGALVDYRFTPSLIRVSRQLTYEQVNEMLREEDTLGRMDLLCRKLRQRRIDNGALILSLPEVVVRCEPDSSVRIEMEEQETPSRTLVAEFMILYNWLAARFFRDHNIPVLFRTQEAPSERLSMNHAGYTYYVFKQRRKLHPLMIDTRPGAHAGLGLDAYTNLSSPIRRYADLLAQRQLRGFLLRGEPFYGEEELEKIRLSLAPLLKDLDRVKRNRVRYWLLKYLHQHGGESFPALVLDVMRNRFRILLIDLLMVAEMRRQDGPDLAEGQQILARVKKSDPWNDELILEYAGS
ncbi:MAG: RNB domain-containing ribonuclease [Deltaproteobacteria bacterium]|nr:RNB domain-containing ribonuclease [Deltaproteobacteria bacterium]